MFVGRQWPFMIIKRKSDGKLLNVSDKKVRVYESMYTIPLLEEYDPTVFPEIVPDEKEKVIVNNEAAPRPEVDNNMVASIKSLREHKLQLPGSETCQRYDENRRIGDVWKWSPDNRRYSSRPSRQFQR